MVRSSYFADRQYHGEPVPAVRRKVDPAKKSQYKLSKRKQEYIEIERVLKFSRFFFEF